MAEAFLRKIGGDRFIVFSAGIDPLPINYCTKEVMAELGYDLKDQYSKNYCEYDEVKFDFAITLCDRAERKCKNIPHFGDCLHWSFRDPGPCRNRSVEELEKYRTVRDQILRKIKYWLKTEFA
jgi:arsenate reductase